MPQARTVPRKISAGVILVDPEGRVLLQLRDADPGIPFPDHWGITGGAGHEGETPEQTARREVTEETGLVLAKITPFRAYYFQETRTAAGAKASAKRGADYELYLFHAPCSTPAAEMTCGEGRGLRFFSPDDLDGLAIAYNHRDVLADFFASQDYALYLRGVPFGGGDADAVEPLAAYVAALEDGTPWFDAMVQAIARWETPLETVRDRQYRYLIGGEAFDWLLLAERLIEAAPALVPADEAERLLFRGQPPGDEGAPAGGRINDERLRALIGDAKHRAHLNYLYGVTVEEALQYAVELEVSKERATVNIRDPRHDDATIDPVYERVYGRSRAELLREFREAATLAHPRHLSLAELREFMYWLFKYRVRTCEPARVASDTRKALAQLSSMEAAVLRSRRAGQPDAQEQQAGAELRRAL
ncbi:MAG TPA: NUDIX domain-containing protein [Dehalococcoidia bacterium]|nr:NUDIX domain-containing protein [Dehalococcoidia bacterium]